MLITMGSLDEKVEVESYLFEGGCWLQDIRYCGNG